RARLHRRRQPRNRAPADRRADRDIARRQHYLRYSCRRYAAREDALLDRAFRRQGDAPPQVLLAGIRRRRAVLDPPARQTRRSRNLGRGGRAMTTRSQLLEVAGGRRTIEVFEAGDGEPLVFLHGEGGLAADSPFLAALARGRHVFAPLLPGYGLSSG